MCVHKYRWTSKYAYAYLKLLERKDLWPVRLLYISISKAIELAEKMPDPIPKEPSITYTYKYKHAAPEYRRDRCWSLDDLNNSIGLCLHCVRSGSTDSYYNHGSYSAQDQSSALKIVLSLTYNRNKVLPNRQVRVSKSFTAMVIEGFKSRNLQASNFLTNYRQAGKSNPNIYITPESMIFNKHPLKPMYKPVRKCSPSLPVSRPWLLTAFLK